MADLSEKYTKILSDIEAHISDPEERRYVSKKISELSAVYLELLDRSTKINCIKMNKIEQDQEKLISKVAKIQETVNSIQNDIYEYDGYDFEIVCPYCNHEFIVELNDDNKNETECPECHNMIELEWEDTDSKDIQEKKKQNDDEDDDF